MHRTRTRTRTRTAGLPLLALVGERGCTLCLCGPVLFLSLVVLNQGTCLLIDNIPTHRVPLRHNDPLSPFALAVSLAVDVNQTVTKHAPSPPLFPHCNFLASQVWPSARVAAYSVETFLAAAAAEAEASDRRPRVVSICEFGCGPGLPSLTAAAFSRWNKNNKNRITTHVTATDMDPVALALVQKAAREQQIEAHLTTRPLDLLADPVEVVRKHHQFPILHHADLYIFSDVFESNQVARAAAVWTQFLLSQQLPSRTHTCSATSYDTASSIWVFAQSDRAQRDVYLSDLKRLLHDYTLKWTSVEQGPPLPSPPNHVHAYSKSNIHSRLWLCDVDETRVQY